MPVPVYKPSGILAGIDSAIDRKNRRLRNEGLGLENIQRRVELDEYIQDTPIRRKIRKAQGMEADVDMANNQWALDNLELLQEAAEVSTKADTAKNQAVIDAARDEVAYRTLGAIANNEEVYNTTLMQEMTKEKGGQATDIDVSPFINEDGSIKPYKQAIQEGVFSVETQRLLMNLDTVRQILLLGEKGKHTGKSVWENLQTRHRSRVLQLVGSPDALNNMSADEITALMSKVYEEEKIYSMEGRTIATPIPDEDEIITARNHVIDSDPDKYGDDGHELRGLQYYAAFLAAEAKGNVRVQQALGTSLNFMEELQKVHEEYGPRLIREKSGWTVGTEDYYVDMGQLKNIIRFTRPTTQIIGPDIDRALSPNPQDRGPQPPGGVPSVSYDDYVKKK